MEPEFQNRIFSQALNIQKPWYISRIEFKREVKSLNIWVDFGRGAKFSCTDCGEENCEIHATVEKKWRHPGFFQYKTYVHCRVPRVTCEKCRIRLMEVPWSR